MPIKRLKLNENHVETHSMASCFSINSTGDALNKNIDYGHLSSQQISNRYIIRSPRNDITNETCGEPFNYKEYANKTFRNALLDCKDTIEKPQLKMDKKNSKKTKLDSLSGASTSSCLSERSSNSSTPHCLSSPKSKQSILQDELAESFEIIDLSKSKEMNEEDIKSLESMLKPISQILKYNLKLNITRKDTLIYLIERNNTNKIFSPFDLFAYSRLKSTNLNKLVETLTIQHLSETKNDYNYLNIRKVSKLLKRFSLNDKNFLKQNNLMPNCLSSFLMSYFFDIFSMTELQKYGKNTVGLMLNLKRSIKPQLNLDAQSLTSNLTENIIWNCIILFRNKFDYKKTVLRNGFLNFYLSYLYILINLEMVVTEIQRTNLHFDANSIRTEIKRTIELNFMLPHLLDAFVLTGHFQPRDYFDFKKFFEDKFLHKKIENQPLSSHDINYNNNRSINDIEEAYLNSAMKNLSQTADTCFPLKLKNLCRIKIRNSLTICAWESLDNLNIPNTTKRFLMYEYEIENMYMKNLNFLNSNNT